MVRVLRDTLDRTDFHTLRGIKMTDTLGTLHRIDFINFDALVNGFVGAFGFAHIAIDAFFGDCQCQRFLPAKPESFLECSFNFHTDKL